ncbi:hypothetical protein C1S65_07930 [Pseudomonas putida]|uniref:Uncharacterized protein n=1 Tax=Pseudomonas putida TaxID=303 RepID=A0AAD0PDD8_PSEPU|nr:hypothetical protein C1S65_07930 [Pseudomonas putida]
MGAAVRRPDLPANTGVASARQRDIFFAGKPAPTSRGGFIAGLWPQCTELRPTSRSFSNALAIALR